MSEHKKPNQNEINPSTGINQEFLNLISQLAMEDPLMGHPFERPSTTDQQQRLDIIKKRHHQQWQAAGITSIVMSKASRRLPNQLDGDTKLQFSRSLSKNRQGQIIEGWSIKVVKPNQQTTEDGDDFITLSRVPLGMAIGDKLIPSRSFTDDQLNLVSSQVRELDDLRNSDILPDLNWQLTSIQSALPFGKD